MGGRQRASHLCVDLILFMKFEATYAPAATEFRDGISFLRSDGMLALTTDLRSKYIGMCNDGERMSSSFLAKNLIPHTGCEPTAAYGAVIETKDGPILDMASQTVNTVLGQNDIWVLANINAFNLSGYPSFLSSRFTNAYSKLLAEKISSIGGIVNARVNHRLCSGAAAIESLLTNAWNYSCTKYGDDASGRMVGSFKGGFHGQTGNAGKISWIQKGLKLPFQDAGSEQGKVMFFETPTTASFDHHEVLSDGEVEIMEQIRQHREELFLVIIEPLLMNYGVVTPSLSFIQALRETCTECDIPLAFDEVQTAFGWLGTMSAAEKLRVAPDMLAVSKGLTGGYGPLSASICSTKFSQESGTGESTNGSDLRAMVAAKAVLERLAGIQWEDIPACLPTSLAEELHEGLLHWVPKKAKSLRMRLRDLTGKYENIAGALRGDGLICGLPLLDKLGKPSPALAAAVYRDLISRGVFARASHDALIIKPPLVITESEIDFAIEQLGNSLRKFSNHPLC